MATLAELRSEARKLGIAPSVVRNASTARELRAVIEDFESESNGARKKSTVKKAVKKAVVKKATATPTKPRRGRPPGSKNRPKPATTKATASKSAPARSTASRGTGKAKRQTAASSNGGRNMLGKVNYSRTDGWQPREGSAPDRIVKALKRFKGDRDKVFNFLKADVWDFCSRRMRDGTKRKLRGAAYGAEEMLRYRIARTDWDFAVRTGQHNPSEDRVEYGTGGTGEGIYKPVKAVKKAPAKAKARGTTRSTVKRSTAAKQAPVKRGRPTGSTKAASVKPRRGRPPGSKNRPKVTATATKPRRGRPPGSKNRPR